MAAGVAAARLFSSSTLTESDPEAMDRRLPPQDTETRFVVEPG
jgi:hypothetical protein